jgi:hypothetical protein
MRRVILAIIAVTLSLTTLPAPAAPTDSCPPEANCMCYIAGIERTPPEERNGGGLLKYQVKEQCVQVPRY